MTQSTRITTVACPTCKTLVEWNEKQAWRPFCSERCQKIDFGDWASETFTIAGGSALDDNYGEEL